MKKKLKALIKRVKDRPQDIPRMLVQGMLMFYFKKIKGNKGIYVMEEEWDNLIILDACRYDMMRDYMGKDIDSRISRGGATLEWLGENFKGKHHEDVIYINSNPYVDLHFDKCFHKVVPVWKLDWSEEHGTVLPFPVCKYAKMVRKMYPDKRFIIHFMQPHFPFVNYPEMKSSLLQLKELAEKGEGQLGAKSVWVNLLEGKFTKDEVWKAYYDNLDYIMPYILKLVKELPGKTVVSSDHANIYKKILGVTFAGHFHGLYFKDLVKVPWMVFEKGELQ